jgi:hypothetical protein
MTLHIFAQEQWHDSAYIVGTKEDLKRLEAAISMALGKGDEKCPFFVNDGEGYDVVIRVVDELTAGNLAVPYTEEMASEKEGSRRIRPWELRFDNPGELK